ncbi:hypothetical protein, partial [Massilia mucilaginosa]|uniref:hypothetical protein n=1 Tax=Massilia mucilaginosa TaxID=2609282 RepID=UPI001CB6CDBF
MTLTTPCARKAHMLAWQARRGARHNAYSVNPKGAQRSPHQAKRSVATGAICDRMPRYVKA